jgi:hypothetical protein
MTLSAVEGRLKSLCVAGDGKLVTHARLDTALAGVAGLEQYRVDQDTPVHVRCTVVGEPGGGALAAKGAKEALGEIFGPHVRVDAVEVPALFAEESGKFLLVNRSFPLGEAIHAR